MRFDSNVSVKIKDAYAARHEPEAELFLGRLYWAFLVVLFAVTLIVSIAFGVFEFLQPLTSDSTAVVGGRPQKTLTKSDLEKVLDGFDARASTYNSRKTAPVLVRDPS